jgi:hypothetical protein
LSWEGGGASNKHVTAAVKRLFAWIHRLQPDCLGGTRRMGRSTNKTDCGKTDQAQKDDYGPYSPKILHHNTYLSFPTTNKKFTEVSEVRAYIQEWKAELNDGHEACNAYSGYFYTSSTETV